MDKYDKIEVVGEGSYGIVIKCKHRETGQVVAIKKFLETEDDHMVRKMALREIRMLKKLRHENLVSMIEVFRRNRRFYLVFEFMDHTILDELEDNTSGLGDEVTRQHIYQVIRGIDYCHNNKVVHRDVKPENVLVSRLGVIKLCDFGFARLLSTHGETYTDYVATRWYRAPELLVGDTKYGREVDIWAIGCLFTEMMTGDPLFPGDSDIDQLFQITKMLGKLSNRHQQLLTRNPMFNGMKKIHDEGGLRSLSKSFPSWPYLALDFVSICLKLDPGQRPTSRELLHHPYFIHDNFVERFLPELRSKVQQEFQGNPLLRKYCQSSLSLASAARRSRDRASGDAAEGNKSMSFIQRRGSFMEPPRWKINISNDQNNPNNENRRISMDSKTKPVPVATRRRLSDNCSSTSTKMEVSEECNNFSRSELFKSSLNNGQGIFFKPLNNKPQEVPSLEVTEESNNFSRSELFKSSLNNGQGMFFKQLNNKQQEVPSPTVDVSPPSPSPPPFQSLQCSGYSQAVNYGVNGDSGPHTSMQVLHPTINNLSFGSREGGSGSHHLGGTASLVTSSVSSGNIVGPASSFIGKTVEPLKRSPQPLANRPREKVLPMTTMIPRSNMIRRLDRGLYVDMGQVDKTQMMLGPESPNHDKWHSNRKLGAIKTNENAAWRANKGGNDEFSLPNVPGASNSPNKTMKKKLNGINLHTSTGDSFMAHSNTTSRPPSQSPKPRFNSKNFPFV